MEPTDATIQILQKIQETLVAQRDDFAGLRSEVAGLGECLGALERATAAGFAKLHDDVAITNETLGVIRERLVFAEAASSAATGARARLDDRVDRLDAEVGRLRERLDAIERGG